MEHTVLAVLFWIDYLQTSFPEQVDKEIQKFIKVLFQKNKPP